MGGERGLGRRKSQGTLAEEMMRWEKQSVLRVGEGLCIEAYI